MLSKSPPVSWTDANQHSKVALDTKWNCDGSLLLSVGADKVWRVGGFESTGHVRPVHSVPTAAILNACCWHPTETERFAVAGEDKYVDVWDARASRAAGRIATTSSNLSMSWSPDENYIGLINKLDFMSVLDVRTMKQVKRTKAQYELNELAWSHNSDHLLVAGSADGKGSVDVNRFQDGELTHISSVVCHTSGCTTLKVDSGFQRMAVGSLDFSVSLWNLEDLVCYATVDIETSARSLSYSNDGRHLVVCGDTAAFSVVNCNDGEIVMTVPLRSPAMAAAWNPRYQSVIALALEDKGNKEEFVRLANISLPT